LPTFCPPRECRCLSPASRPQGRRRSPSGSESRRRRASKSRNRCCDSGSRNRCRNRSPGGSPPLALRIRQPLPPRLRIWEPLPRLRIEESLPQPQPRGFATVARYQANDVAARAWMGAIARSLERGVKNRALVLWAYFIDARTWSGSTGWYVCIGLPLVIESSGLLYIERDCTRNICLYLEVVSILLLNYF
jgi:hypothetical protein